MESDDEIQKSEEENGGTKLPQKFTGSPIDFFLQEYKNQSGEMSQDNQDNENTQKDEHDETNQDDSKNKVDDIDGFLEIALEKIYS